MEAFNKAKSMLASTELLVHVDPKKDLIISCDACSYGVGAVLLHKVIDGTEQPINHVHIQIIRYRREEIFTIGIGRPSD